MKNQFVWKRGREGRIVLRLVLQIKGNGSGDMLFLSPFVSSRLLKSAVDVGESCLFTRVLLKAEIGALLCLSTQCSPTVTSLK